MDVKRRQRWERQADGKSVKAVDLGEVGMDFWDGKKVFVTGGHGFLGSAVVRALKHLPVESIQTPTHRDLNLEERHVLIPDRYDVLIHCAGVVGGLFENMRRPAEFLESNLLMGLNVLRMAREARIGKVVMAGSSCMYPESFHQPYVHNMLWNGPPAGGNLGYGAAKRVLFEAGVAYKKQYGLDVITAVLPNLYGPGDDFDPQTGHVVGSLVGKMLDARARGLERLLMSGTGRAIREFMFVDDGAQALLFAAETFSSEVWPINIGTGHEYSVRDVAEMVKTAVGFKGELVWGESGLDGQGRKVMDSGMAKMKGWEPKVSFPEGIRKTVESLAVVV